MPLLEIPIHRVRYESFGGIISCTNPPFLAWVNRDYMRKLGYTDSPRWQDNNDLPQSLSAPTEVHFSITNTCTQRCTGCYMNSGTAENNQLSLDEIYKTLIILGKMGVFHVAFGGGEAFTYEHFYDIIMFCKELGMVPNCTTNGQNIGANEVALCRFLGQVNISIDGIGSRFTINGRDGSFNKADAALRLLKKEGIPVGINCVVSRKNFPYLGELVRYAAQLEIHEIEFLKFKPSGRGADAYEEYALSPEMIRSFYPIVLKYADESGVELKADCSFIPAIVYHNPPIEDLEKLGVVGCDGGNLLMAIGSNGTFSGCSFVTNDEPVSEIISRWNSSSHLNRFRSLVTNAKEPCKSCEYLPVCRCGCRAVALYRTGDFYAPDPECPKVYR